jgi:hypothetical protein
MNEGVGVRASKIYPYLDKHKCFVAVSNQLPDEEIREDSFDIENFLHGDPFDDIGDFMCCLDDTATFTYGDNGNGESYCLYPPTYPWERLENEPTNIKEVHKRLIKIILHITNLTEQQAEELIENDIYEYGCG